VAHTERPRDLNQRLPRSPSGQSFAPLISGERKLPAKLDASRLRPLPSLIRPLRERAWRRVLGIVGAANTGLIGRRQASTVPSTLWLKRHLQTSPKFSESGALHQGDLTQLPPCNVSCSVAALGFSPRDRLRRTPTRRIPEQPRPLESFPRPCSERCTQRRPCELLRITRR